jgi:hypothetical protein
MSKLTSAFVVGLAVSVSAFSQQKGNPFLGRWDFNITTATSTRGSWLGVTDNGGNVEVWYQPTGGNVLPMKDFKIEGAHLTLVVSPASGARPAVSWELDANGDRLIGVQKRRDSTMPLTGVRAPDLKRSEPKAWSAPEALFNGKSLDGWQPMENNSHWIVRDGLLVNEDKGANLKSVRTFEDFKLHFEVSCPDDANSGFYLRGRYEVQIESEPLTSNPPERRIGSIYGRIAPKPELPRTPGAWEVFDVTFVGRIVTVVHNGVTTIDHREIEGPTGGALDANEGEPGPFYIQGDHTGGLKFRNITVSVPQK